MDREKFFFNAWLCLISPKYNPSLTHSVTKKSSRIRLETLGLGNVAQVPGNGPKIGKNHAACSPVAATFWSLSGYISARLLVTKRSKIFPLSN